MILATNHMSRNAYSRTSSGYKTRRRTCMQKASREGHELFASGVSLKSAPHAPLFAYVVQFLLPTHTDVLSARVICWKSPISTANMAARQASISRKTNETQIEVFIDLDCAPGMQKTQTIEVSTGIGFLDHVRPFILVLLVIYRSMDRCILR